MIKQLDKTFVKNCDGLGDMKFIQVKHDGDVYMYQRQKMDGSLHSYECFLAVKILAGAKLPNGEVVKESYVRYVTSNSKNAFFCSTRESAEIRYNQLIKKVKDNEVVDSDEDLVTKVVSKGCRGRKAKLRPTVVIPSTKTFGMKDLLKINPAYNQPLLYIAVKNDKRIKRVGTKPNESGKGMPSVVYSAV